LPWIDALERERNEGGKERLNFIGRVANNFFVGEAVISDATDASQLAIFYSFFTRRFMLPALFLSPPSLE
jgi:hypothetical protein